MSWLGNVRRFQCTDDRDVLEIVKWLLYSSKMKHVVSQCVLVSYDIMWLTTKLSRPGVTVGWLNSSVQKSQSFSVVVSRDHMATTYNVWSKTKTRTVNVGYKCNGLGGNSEVSAKVGAVAEWFRALDWQPGGPAWVRIPLRQLICFGTLAIPFITLCHCSLLRSEEH